MVAVKASLSIYGGEGSAPDHVTSVLGVEPTRSHEFGELHRGARMAAAGRRYPSSRWDYEQLESRASDDDPHGMASLDSLVRLFEPLADRLRQLREEGYWMRVWLLADSDSSQSGFVLSPETMAGLGAMGTPLFGDIFVSPEDEA